MLFILITIAIFILKFLSVGVVGLFLIEDLELTKSANTILYSIYFIIGITAFISLFFFALGKKLLWLIIFLVNACFYLFMYNSAPSIKDIHAQNNLKSRYFKDTSTFINRMKDVIKLIDSKS